MGAAAITVLDTDSELDMGLLPDPGVDVIRKGSIQHQHQTVRRGAFHRVRLSRGPKVRVCALARHVVTRGTMAMAALVQDYRYDLGLGTGNSCNYKCQMAILQSNRSFSDRSLRNMLGLKFAQGTLGIRVA